METREEERKKRKKIAHTKFLLLFFVFFFLLLPSKNICLFQISLDGETAYRLHICTSCLIYSAGFWRMRKKKRVGGFRLLDFANGAFFLFIIPPILLSCIFSFFFSFFFLLSFLSVFIELAYGAFLKKHESKDIPQKLHVLCTKDRQMIHSFSPKCKYIYFLCLFYI